MSVYLLEQVLLLFPLVGSFCFPSLEFRRVPFLVLRSPSFMRIIGIYIYIPFLAFFLPIGVFVVGWNLASILLVDPDVLVLLLVQKTTLTSVAA